MAGIGFIGLGNMGRPMARNLAGAGHAVRGFDIAGAARAAAKADGIAVADDLAGALDGAEAVFTMLPAGDEVRAVYTAPGGLIARARPETPLIDCSTIDLRTARDVHRAAAGKGLAHLDAPVSGGRSGRGRGRHAHLHGGAARSPPSWKGRAPVGGDGPQHRPCRRSGQRPGREDVQQHDPGRVHDRGLGSVRARRAHRARRPDAVRCRVRRLGPVLVAHLLLPGAGAGAVLAPPTAAMRPGSPPG